MTKLQSNRVCILIDFDSFDVQICQKYLYPETVGQPCIVAHSYNENDSLAAVNHEAKSYGIKRSDTLSIAYEKCPNVNLLRFPRRLNNPDKPDMSLQKQATKEILTTALEFCETFDESVRPILEHSSCDEFFLDVTSLVNSATHNHIFHEEEDSLKGNEQIDESNSNYKFIVEDDQGSLAAKDWSSSNNTNNQDLKLYHGLIIASEVVQLLKIKIGLHASAGISYNKLLAKLACCLNKPLALTLIVPSGLQQVSRRIQIPNIPGLGGTAGKALMKTLLLVRSDDDDDKNEDVELEGQQFVRTMKDLASFTETQIANVYTDETKTKQIGSKRALTIYNSVHGIDNNTINFKLGPKSLWKEEEI